MSVTSPSSPTIIKGSVIELTADLSNLSGADVDATGYQWLVRDPNGVEQDMTPQVNHPGVGLYTLDVEGDTVGVWYWRLVTQGTVVAANGSFTVVDDYSVVGDPTKPVDLRVLVPRARRYCEGPFGPPAGKPTLAEDVLYPMVADAAADIIMLTGSLFGHQLVVTSRDARVGFPTGWATETVLDEWEGSVIISQVALNYFFFYLRDLRTSESIKNEGTEWSYSLSANVLRDYLGNLRDARDMALAGLQKHHPVLDRYASNIRVRDQATVAVLEWWDTVSPGVGGAAMPGGQEAAVIPWTPGWSGPNFTP